MIIPNLETSKKYADKYSLIPVSMELLADMRTGVEILRSLKACGRNAFILESAADGESWGRYTFLGYDPLMTVYGNGNENYIINDGRCSTVNGDTKAVLKNLLAKYRSPRLTGMPYFTGGFVGYFAYEFAVNGVPGLKLSSQRCTDSEDYRLMMFDKIIAIDNYRQKIVLIVNVSTDNLEENYIQGISTLKDMERIILTQAPPVTGQSGLISDFKPLKSKDEFVLMVDEAKKHIFEGDIFQCVPSNRFEAEYEGDLLSAYRTLRTLNPSSYMFCLDTGEMQIAGASPETLVSLRGRTLTTYPLAGSCRRGETPEETEEAINAMLNDPKELAEHDMLVDLGRNDLGKIADFGTVKVPVYRLVKKCSRICHIASQVNAEINKELSAIDAICAVMPAGTLSGAPKRRAMEIIDKLEGAARGPYGGALGYIDFNGDMDMCIGIRMAVLKKGKVYVQAGAGIVADSVPENEYNECYRKASAMIDALMQARRIR